MFYVLVDFKDRNVNCVYEIEKRKEKNNRRKMAFDLPVTPYNVNSISIGKYTANL